MSRVFSLPELSTLLKTEKLVKPRMDDVARSCLGVAAKAVEAIGLPERVADAFRSSNEVIACPHADGYIYKVDGTEVVIHRAVEIGRTEFGFHVVDCDTGCVVYLDSSGASQLINTSLERFLYFVGRFRQSANGGFNDADTLLADCKKADPEPLANPEGMWSLMFEEAAAGLY